MVFLKKLLNLSVNGECMSLYTMHCNKNILFFWVYECEHNTKKENTWLQQLCYQRIYFFSSALVGMWCE